MIVRDTWRRKRTTSPPCARSCRDGGRAAALLRRRVTDARDRIMAGGQLAGGRCAEYGP